MAKKNSKKPFWSILRIFALFVMITSIIQILNAVSSTHWRNEVAAILQTQHRYFSDTVSAIASYISVVWWCVILFGSLLLFIDKDLDTFFNKAIKAGGGNGRD